MRSTSAPASTPAATLRERDAGRYITFSAAWLRQRRMHGDGPTYVKVGRSIRYRVADLDAYVAAHRVVPGAEV